MEYVNEPNSYISLVVNTLECTIYCCIWLYLSMIWTKWKSSLARRKRKWENLVFQLCSLFKLTKHCRTGQCFVRLQQGRGHVSCTNAQFWCRRPLIKTLSFYSNKKKKIGTNTVKCNNRLVCLWSKMSTFQTDFLPPKNAGSRMPT